MASPTVPSRQSSLEMEQISPITSLSTERQDSRPVSPEPARIPIPYQPVAEPKSSSRLSVSSMAKTLEKSRRSQACWNRFMGYWSVISNRWWFWEIGALICSCLCMVAALIMLSMVNGNALDKWKLPIQLNSLLSVLMTVSKSTLLVAAAECISQAKWMQFENSAQRLNRLQDFDNASRGPWGSFQLLVGPKGMGYVARLGAAVTVLSLALDPFTQQIVAFPSRPVESSKGSASFAAMQSLNTIDEAKIHGSVFNGVYDSHITADTVNCTTSQCHWINPVTTLGVCGACRDVTSFVEVDCEPVFLEKGTQQAGNLTLTNCTYKIDESTSIDVYIQTLTIPGADGEHDEYANQYTNYKIVSPRAEQGLGNLIDPSATWIQVLVAYATFFNEATNIMPSMTLEILRPNISICGFYWCAQVYENLRVVNGTLVTVDPSNNYTLELKPTKNSNWRPQKTDKRGYSILTVPERFTDQFPGNATFEVNKKTHNKIELFLNKLFSVTRSNGNEVFGNFPEPESGFFGFARAVYQNQSISETFNRVAKSMSSQMRVTESRQAVRGQAIENETYIDVRWSWTAAPLTILVFSMALLVITIMKNGRTAVWKSSSIALLCHDVEGLSIDDRQLDTLEDLTKFANETDVKLDGSHAWKMTISRTSTPRM